MSPLSNRRTPDEIALQLLETLHKGETTKWGLIKVLGNETQFKLWIEDFFIPEKILEEHREGRNYFYTITERGILFHQLLKNGNMIKIFNKISGKRLR